MADPGRIALPKLYLRRGLLKLRADDGRLYLVDDVEVLFALAGLMIYLDDFGDYVPARWFGGNYG